MKIRDWATWRRKSRGGVYDPPSWGTSDETAEPEPVRRLRHVARFALIWAIIIIVRLVYLQIFSHAEYSHLAEQQQERMLEILAPRGTIYDRSGEPLAMSVPVDSVCINPQQIKDFAVAAEILSGVLNIDKQQLLERMRWAKEADRGFLWVKRKLEPEESRRLRALNLGWVEFRKESRRFYPKGQLASHVIGAVDHRERGNAGLELSLDDELAGRAGALRMMADVRQRGFETEVSVEPVPGVSLTTTIDERIQFTAEQALAEAVVSNRCTTGSLVVMDPRNGDILALANYPTFDPNAPVADLENRANLSVSTPFEPGSVFKVITVSAALETTRLRPETIIPCGNGSINLFGRLIRDHKAHSALPMEEVIAKSSNIGAINIALQVGNERLLEYVRRFGFGSRTGVPLPGESSGLVRDLRLWGKSSIGSVAMGHEISTTTVQLAQACSAIANGGLLIKPRLILQRQAPGMKAEPQPLHPAKRILKPETSITMRRMMEGVVLHGTGTRAKLDGYTAGGKTGSAQIFDLVHRVYTHKYNASFIGFAPLTNPAIVVVVTLNGASKFGGAVAAPVFREVASTALRILDVPRDLPYELPQLAKKEEPEDDYDLAIAEVGGAPDAEMLLAATGSAPEGNGSTPVLVPAAYPAELLGPAVPDFSGKTVRKVIEESAAQGLPVEFTGSGVARGQYPPAGVRLKSGERVRVRFAR